MSLTVDRPVEPTPGEPPRALARAEGLELLGEVSGSGYKEGVSLVRRADGQMVQLGPLQYALLEAVDGERDVPGLAAAASERLGRRLEAEHVVKIAEKLAEQGLLAGTEENAPERSNPLLALRWKVLFTDPKVTGRITAPFKWLFRPWIVLPALLGFAAVLWFVLIHEGVAPATAQAFDKPELLLLILGLTVASAAFHEIGHAAACRYGGGRPGGMGAGIYVVWPAFYTDVTDAYRLPRRSRLRTDLGGIYFNAVVAVLALGVWLATGLDVLLLLIGLQMLEMLKNLSPVIRADGYHVLSDATGVPDLYAHMGPTLKRLLPWKRQRALGTHRPGASLGHRVGAGDRPDPARAWRSAPSCCSPSWPPRRMRAATTSSRRSPTRASSGGSRRSSACSRLRSRSPAPPSSSSACSARRGARPGAGARAARRARRWCSPAPPR